MEITSEQLEQYFQSLKRFLLNKENIHHPNTIKQNITLETGAGIYCVFDSMRLCYVGESGCLFGRIKDFHRTLNHTFRRSLGEAVFSSHQFYKKANTKEKFHVDIELLLDKYINEKIMISYKPISIGRKEFEEWMQQNSPETKFLNKRKKKVASGLQLAKRIECDDDDQSELLHLVP